MLVHCYDSNPGDWSLNDFITNLPIGPEAALAWLCNDNEDKEDENGDPLGPIKYGGDTNRFVLVSAWTMGRQWFKVLAIFTAERLSEEECEKILAEYVPEEIERRKEEAEADAEYDDEDDE